MKVREWVVEQWKDLDITARFIDTVWDNETHGYEFELFEIVGWTGDNFKELLYERKGSTMSGDHSKNGLEDAQPYLTGFIKWDGCSHMYFGDEGYLHLCGLNTFEKLQKVLQKLIDRAREKGVQDI